MNRKLRSTKSVQQIKDEEISIVRSNKHCKGC